MSASTDAVRAAYDALARGDLPALLDFFDPAVAWTEAERFPDAGPHSGHDAVMSGVIGRLATGWDGFRAPADEIIDGGDQVVVMGRYSGTCKATGKPTEAASAHVWTLRDGKAVRFRQYVDSALVQEALRP